MRREYVGACDELQSETILLLPVLAMVATASHAAGLELRQTVWAMQVFGTGYGWEEF
jgi:hypothetical protein